MLFQGPLHGDFYLSFGETVVAETAGEGVLLRVIGSNGYPHDLRVGAENLVKLRAGRVFAPIVANGKALHLSFVGGSEGTGDTSVSFTILCANCFAKIWTESLANGADVAVIVQAETSFWSMPTLPGCPRCFAAAARAH